MSPRWAAVTDTGRSSFSTSFLQERNHRIFSRFLTKVGPLSRKGCLNNTQIVQTLSISGLTQI